MECHRRFFIGIVLIFVSAPVVRNELVQNVSSAVIRLDGMSANTLTKKTKLNSQLRYLDVIETYSNCSGLEILSEEFQPKYSSESSFIRKCCPNGESYEIGENGRQCAADTSNFNVSILNATFYENCIEDNELSPKLDLVVLDACRSGVHNDNSNSKNEAKNQLVLYSKLYGDLLYIIQNGSLLTVDENFEGYEVHNNYCLDMNRSDGFLYAIVCDQKSNHQTKTNRVLRAEAYLYSTCLLISVPCLLLTAFFYVNIDELRDLHGKSLACHCVCLAIAYSFLIIIQFQQDILLPITYCIQYFLLSCICWLSVLCFDICFKISYTYLKKYSYCSVNTEDKYFTTYAIVSFGLPILPVVVAASQHMFGIPLYYIKGLHNNTTSDNYFIVPATILLLCCCCFLLMALYFFGTKRPKPPNESQGPEAICEYEEFFKLKQTAQSVAFLFALMSMCMIIEMLISHINISTGPKEAAAMSSSMSPFAFFDVLIALQGVFIFIIFICAPKPLRIIKRWWIATGSLDVAAFTELEALKKHSVLN